MLLILTSITGLFRLIVSFLIFFLLVRWIFSLFTGSSQNNSTPSASYTSPNGETTADTNTEKGKIIKADEGEYVDFEEIE